MLLRSLLLVTACSASDIIYADGNSPAERAALGIETQPYQPTHHHQHYQQQPRQPMSEEEYQRSYYSGTGAGGGTIWIMMSTVTLGYLLLFFVFSTACFSRPAVGAQPVPFQRFPEMDPEQEALKSAVVAELEPMWRKAFIGKVYTLLCTQIAITIGVSFAMMTLGGYDFYVWSLTEGAWTRMAAMLLTFVLIIAMICCKQRYPINLLMLLTFTLAMSYTIGTVCTAFAAAGMMMIVIEAFAITSLIFIALTIFTMQSKIDFSYLGMILPILLFTLIIWGFFAMFAFPSFATSQLYALAGTLLFCLYILYDTWSITTMLSYDDYVLGAINLYLDFINLFLFILQLLVGMRRD